MKKFVKRLRQEEQGLTLVELLVTVTIFSMVMMAIYGTIHFGLAAYHRITIENSLRDEGDLLMSTVITELYSFAPDTVTQTNGGLTLGKKDANDAETTSVLRLENNAMYIGADKIDIRSSVLDTSSITMTCTANSDSGTPAAGGKPCTAGLIEINLELNQQYDGRDHSLKLQSRFGF